MDVAHAGGIQDTLAYLLPIITQRYDDLARDGLFHSSLASLAPFEGVELAADSVWVLTLHFRGSMEHNASLAQNITILCRRMADFMAIPVCDRACLAVVVIFDEMWNASTCDAIGALLDDAGYSLWAGTGIYGQFTPIGALVLQLTQEGIDLYTDVRDVPEIASTQRGVPVLAEYAQLEAWQPPSAEQEWRMPPRTFLRSLPLYVHAVARHGILPIMGFLQRWIEETRDQKIVHLSALKREITERCMTPEYTRNSPEPDKSLAFRMRTNTRVYMNSATRGAYATLDVIVDGLDCKSIRDETINSQRAQIPASMVVGDPLSVTATAYAIYAGATALQRILAACAVCTRTAGTLVQRLELDSIATLPEVGLSTRLYQNVSAAVAVLDTHFGSEPWDDDVKRRTPDVTGDTEAIVCVPPSTKGSSAHPLLVRTLAPRDTGVPARHFGDSGASFKRDEQW